MIAARDIDAVLRDVPFKPFKIHLTNGIPRADSQTIMREYHLVSMLHIVQIDLANAA